MRHEGLEPPRISPPPPQGGASTNSASSAFPSNNGCSRLTLHLRPPHPSSDYQSPCVLFAACAAGELEKCSPIRRIAPACCRTRQYCDRWERVLRFTARSYLVGPGGFEPPTPRLSSVCSGQLSYRPDN